MSPPAGLVLFGGAFNPPHETHRKILCHALRVLPVDRAVVLPSGRHPLKGDQDMAPDAARLELCEIAFGDLSGVTVSDLEMRRAGPCYTVDTLRELQAQHPDDRLFLLVGSDNLRILDHWHRHHKLLALATLVTYPRKDHPISRAELERLDLTPTEIDDLLEWVLEVDVDDVSATEIRAHLARGEVPPQLARPVADRIRALGLYGI